MHGDCIHMKFCLAKLFYHIGEINARKYIIRQIKTLKNRTFLEKRMYGYIIK